ncbi:MAG: hypothetical protein A2103_00520 [Gammaproteobacteria bacterium GWF2_41_13]|nr:MAG: hypothetical protein A2103_00520 [Gammaproteobacteria bacterium GWF2_41_13]
MITLNGASDPIKNAQKSSRSDSISRAPSLNPFWGARCLNALKTEHIIPYLNLPHLAKKHWGFSQFDSYAQTALDELIQEDQNKKILAPKAIYGYFSCQSEANDLMIYADHVSREILCRFNFPRQSKGNRLCLADYFRSTQSGERDVVALQLVTSGQGISDYSKALFEKAYYQAYFYWYGLSAAFTTALSEYVHRRIRIELGFSAEEPAQMDAVFQHRYRGARFSLGYSACPELQDQEKILGLLSAHQIGVTLSEAYELIPESSTSAIVVHHPQAQWFFIEDDLD